MEFTFKRCGTEHLGDLLAIQEEAFALLEDDRLLRRNTEEMLASCLREPHITVGVFDGEEMAAFGILYIAGDSAENLGRKIGFEGEEMLATANYKLVIVRPRYRGKGLQRTLAGLLEDEARKLGYRHICSSVSPYNQYSARNFEKAGYERRGRAVLYGGLERDIFYKSLV